MVCCRTFSSIHNTNSPLRWISPRIGGFSLSKVLRPGAPLRRRRRRPGRLFFVLLRVDLCDRRWCRLRRPQPRR
jgi:hypothetical protein